MQICADGSLLNCFVQILRKVGGVGGRISIDCRASINMIHIHLEILTVLLRLRFQSKAARQMLQSFMKL